MFLLIPNMTANSPLYKNMSPLFTEPASLTDMNARRPGSQNDVSLVLWYLQMKQRQKTRQDLNFL